MSEVKVSDARAGLPGLLDRVSEGEEVVITRHGQPVAVLVRPDTLRARRTTAALEKAREVRALLDEAKGKPLSAQAGLSTGRADELVAELRAERDGR